MRDGADRLIGRAISNLALLRAVLADFYQLLPTLGIIGPIDPFGSRTDGKRDLVFREVNYYYLR